MKTKFEKLKPKEVTYRDYKNFEDRDFKHDLIKELKNNTESDKQYELFEHIFLKVPDKYAH